MERQRCVIHAVTQQTTPTVVLTNYEGIIRTGEKNITTNIPRRILPALADLGMKVKGTKTRSLVFDPSTGFHSYAPDWNWVRAKVKKSISETAAGASATPTASGSASPSSTSTAKSTSKSDDLAQVCSYHPKDYTPTKR
jgi:anionic cell wall polymer biosynthesis LytR-Cps2A-Psr (LCP) family protein